jgi:hypothetical protein
MVSWSNHAPFDPSLRPFDKLRVTFTVMVSWSNHAPFDKLRVTFTVIGVRNEGQSPYF